MSQVHTVFGSITDYTKGTIELVSGEARHYVFSNVFEVAAKSKPYERVVVGKNLEYVQEVMRAEGVSPWFACGHDEFALCMDGEITVDFIKLKAPPSADKNGAVIFRKKPRRQQVLPFFSARKLVANEKHGLLRAILREIMCIRSTFD